MPAAVFPSWVLLEPFVFSRDDEESFPDESKAPIRATGTTSWGTQFHIAFSLVEPPQISRLYAQLPVPGFLAEGAPLKILSIHHHLVLGCVASQMPETEELVQSFFIFTADEGPSSSSLKVTPPPCTEPAFDYTRDSDRVPRRRRLPDSAPRLMAVRTMGIWCGGKDEFVVADLGIFKPRKRNKVFADICLLRAGSRPTWKSMRVEFLSTDDPDDADLFHMSWWHTDAVIPYDKWLCWIDYQRGILFCDMSKLPKTPTVSFIWFPQDLPIPGIRKATYSSLYRAVSVINDDRALKFININRHDGIRFAPLKPDTGFTITCHTLETGSNSMSWKEDYMVTSGDLWDANTPERLPCRILMFPQVDGYMPHVAHFLSIDLEYTYKKMWVVSINMSTKTVESVSPYIDWVEGLETDDADLIISKSTSPMPFLPCGFPKFLNSSQKRKHKK